MTEGSVKKRDTEWIKTTSLRFARPKRDSFFAAPYVASKWESQNANTNKKNRLHSQRMETIFILYKTVLTCSNAHALPLQHVGRRPLQG